MNAPEWTAGCNGLSPDAGSRRSGAVNALVHFGACLLLAAAGAAQVDRHELGLRLRTFERQLAATTDEARRGAAYAELDRAVQAFFRFDTQAVAKAIAAAEIALGKPSTPEQEFATSLQVQLAHRLHDPAFSALPFELSAAFAVDAPLPANLSLSMRLDGDETDRVRMAVAELPHGGTIDLAGATPGDRTVTWTLRDGERVLLTRNQGLSLVGDLQPRLAEVKAAAGSRDVAAGSLEAGTLDLWSSLLTGMTRQRREETVLPGARLLADAEQLAAAQAAGKPFFGPERAGQCWLRVPTGKSTTVVRMLVPERTTPAPLVIALHGAGGSENLFFDGYGDGAIVGECSNRGWFLVAPRSGAMGGSDLAALVDALASRWPIDPAAVFVVGHSMGAAQALASVGRDPSRFRAVAALGGGGNVPRAERSKALPFFIGAGERDFAREGARRLHRALQAAGIASTWREYPAVEHLAIVQIALPDVFAFFDRALQPPPPPK